MIYNEKIKYIAVGSYLVIVEDEKTKQCIIDAILEKFEIDKNSFIHLSFCKVDLIKISEIRTIRKKIFLKSVSKNNLVVIDNAQNMTREASNAILKVLEEPPKNVIMLLFVDNFGKMLPTIVSRCKKMIFRNSIEKKLNKRYINVLNELISCKEIYRRFLIAEKIVKNDTDILELLGEWMIFLSKNVNYLNLSRINVINKYVGIYSRNINKRLFLENLFLEI